MVREVRRLVRMQSAALGATLIVITLALWYSVALAGPAAQRGDRVSPGARPVVLLVHGRGLLGQDSAHLRASWRRALQRGASALTGSTVLTDDDVRLVWYADLLNAESEPRMDVARRGTEDATRCEPANDGARTRGMDMDPELGSVVSLLGIVLDAAVPIFAGADGTEMRAFAGDLSYFADASRRCVVAKRLERALGQAHREGRPVIVVAHSLGSLVTYDMLARTDAAARPAIERLVTIGAPLGSRDLRTLVFGERSAGPLTLPRGVKSWVNVVNPGDPLAASLGDSTLAAGLRDVITSSSDSGDSHDVIGYLRDPVTAKAILEAFCAAARDKPRGCERI